MTEKQSTRLAVVFWDFLAVLGIVLVFLALMIIVVDRVGAQTGVGRDDIAIDELEIQIEGRDVLCVVAYFKSQRHGIGLSCDWTNSQATEPADWPQIPTRTPTPPPYPAEVDDERLD